MLRTLMCLPLCLLLAPSYPDTALCQSSSQATERVTGADATGFGGLPDAGRDLVGFLTACLKRYGDTVEGYTLSFHKRERIGAKLHPWETIAVCYREKPHAVFFDWQEGERLVRKSLYVEGENTNASGKSMLLALPAPPLTVWGVVKRDPEGADAKNTGRYPITGFGLRQAMERVLQTSQAAAAEKALHVEYLGLHKVLETGDRVCHKIRRHSFARPEGDDGVTEVTLYVDRETLFQVGTVVLGKDGELLGEYYFRDIRLNPVFGPEQFAPSVVKK